MKLSVSMITYNHEKFIAQAIESVLMQVVDFDYEFVIGEDCSTDNTRKIIEDYQCRYPQIIRLLPSECNLGMNPNFVRTLQACRGQYIALLDGDDYWISPCKLQKQVEFLDSHPDYAVSYHNAMETYEDTGEPSHPRLPENHRLTSSLEDLLSEGDFLPTSSIVYRNGLIEQYPEWFCNLPFGDWSLLILNAQHGKIGYLNEIMSVYRHHANGVLSGANLEIFWKGAIELYHYLDEYLGPRYTRLMKPLVSKRYHLLAVGCEKRGDLRGARAYALQRIATLPFDSNGEQPLKHLARLYFPAIYHLARSCRDSIRRQ